MVDECEWNSAGISVHVPPGSRSAARRSGFSLVELVVAMVVLILLVLLMTLLTNATGRVWKNSRKRIDSFQSARFAYARITAHLSQATLATYWDYYNSAGQSRTDLMRSNSTSPFIPSTYGRTSDLQFVCGQAATLVPPASSRSRPTHAVFLQAPLGYVSDPTGTTVGNDFKALNTVLNAVGYYIDFTDDSSLRPSYMTASVPNWRYRLIELYQPSQNLSIYFSTAPFAGAQAWFTQAVSATQASGSTSTTPTPTIVTADNIVALIVRPEAASAAAVVGTGGGAGTAEIAPGYAYDSKAYLTNQEADGTTPGASYYTQAKNQLPPLVRVTMVAIDADSAARLAGVFGTNPPALYAQSPFTDATQYGKDLAALETVLLGYHCTYRVFVSDVSVLGAQWSTINQ